MQIQHVLEWRRYLQGAFFYCSALKMTKCQPDREISELFLPKKRLRIRDGRPAPRGRGGSPPRPALWGGGGSSPRPAPPRPLKMIKTAGKLRGIIKARISTFSNRGNK